MIDFDTAIELGEEVLTCLEKLYHLIYPTSANGAMTNAARPSAGSAAEADMPSLLQFRRKMLALHAKRHLVTELAATGKLSESEAQAMVDAGSASSTCLGASGSAFANILAWLQANGPTIAQDIAAAIPIIISLITLFGG
jgi:hypothetical protein